MKKHFFKLIFFYLFNACFYGNGNAQSIIFEMDSGVSYATLNIEQKNNFDLLGLNAQSTSYKFVTFNTTAINNPRGLVQIAVADSLIDNKAFKVNGINYIDSNNYNWHGVFYEKNDKSFIKLFVVLNNGKMYANIGTTNSNYFINDIGGAYVMSTGDITDNPNANLGWDPPEFDISPPFSSTQTTCGKDSTKILIVYTQDVVDFYNINPNLQAAACIAYLNQVFANSNIDLQAHLAGVSVLPLLDEPVGNQQDEVVSNSLNKLADYSFETAALRAATKADLVVYMTKYIMNNGMVSAIGTTFDRAYVGMRPFSGSSAIAVEQTFAHEIGHLYGCRHDFGSDPTPGYKHGYRFMVNGNTYRTIMAYPPGQTIDQFSTADPTIKHLGHVTGNATVANNARRVREWKAQNAQYFSDMALFAPFLNMSNGSGSCLQNGTATAVIPNDCPNLGPYSYQWYQSDNGIDWQSIANSNVASINTFVALPTLPNPNMAINTYNARFYKVRLLDVMGSISWGYGVAKYNCINSGEEGPVQPAQKGELINLPTSIDIQLSPNPIDNHFELKIYLPQDENRININLINATGKLVKQLYKGALYKGEHLLQFDKDFAAGSYILLLQSPTTNISKKIIAH